MENLKTIRQLVLNNKINSLELKLIQLIEYLLNHRRKESITTKELRIFTKESFPTIYKGIRRLIKMEYLIPIAIPISRVKYKLCFITKNQYENQNLFYSIYSYKNSERLELQEEMKTFFESLQKVTVTKIKSEEDIVCVGGEIPPELRTLLEVEFKILKSGGKILDKKLKSPENSYFSENPLPPLLQFKNQDFCNRFQNLFKNLKLDDVYILYYLFVPITSIEANTIRFQELLKTRIFVLGDYDALGGKSSGGKKFSPKDEEYQLAELLFHLIKKNRPNTKSPDLQKWSKAIDLMIKQDERDPLEILDVIEWCQKDDFWSGNILSTNKLRQQFDQLAIRMDKSTGVTYTRKFKSNKLAQRLGKEFSKRFLGSGVYIPGKDPNRDQALVEAADKLQIYYGKIMEPNNVSISKTIDLFLNYLESRKSEDRTRVVKTTHISSKGTWKNLFSDYVEENYF